MKRQKSLFGTTLKGVLFAGLAVVVMVVFFSSLHHLESGRSEAGQQQLEESLRQTSVACYAAEGRYPPDLAYMEEHYGLLIDRTRYDVFYDVFAENLMPDITVIEKDS